MTKQSGLGDQLYIDGFDISGDIGSIQSISAPFAVLDLTDITQSAVERRAGIADGAMSFTSYFNPDTDRAHDVLSTLPTADRAGSYFRGSTIGAPAASMWAKQIGYDGNRGADGSFTLATALTATQGTALEWGEQLTAGKRTDSSATNGASLDGTASSTLGLQAYLHLFAFTGTSVTVKLQDSADNSAWADLTGAAFTVATARGAQRIATTSGQTVRRYLRAVTTGTFSNAVFAVNAIRNLAAAP